MLANERENKILKKEIFKSEVVRQILKGVNANLFAQFASILIQILSAPVYLHFWSLEQYGSWLMLTAIPAYLSVMDGGIVAVAANRMIAQEAEGDRHGSRSTFQSALAFLLCICVIIFLFTLGGVAAVSFYLETIIDIQIIFVLALVSLLILFSGILDAVFRANRKYDLGVNIATISRLIEWLIGVLFLFLEHSFLSVALGMLIGRLASIFVIIWYQSVQFPDYVLSFKYANRVLVNDMLRPAIGFIVFPLGMILNIQGLLLVVGHVFGPAYAAIFNTYRVISRVTVQATAVVNKAVWPEFTRLQSLRKKQELQQIYSRTLYLCMAIGLLSTMALYFVFEFLLDKLGHGKIGYDSFLAVLMLIAAFLMSMWQLPYVLMASANRIERLSVFYVVTTVIIGLAILALPESARLSVAICICCVGETLMLAFSTREARRFSGD